MEEKLLIKRINVLEERVAALELVAQRYADIKPKLEAMHNMLKQILPFAQMLKKKQKKGETISFTDKVNLQ